MPRKDSASTSSTLRALIKKLHRNTVAQKLGQYRVSCLCGDLAISQPRIRDIIYQFNGRTLCAGLKVFILGRFDSAYQNALFKVLRYASPTAHIIATSKRAVIVTGRLKGGNYGPFWSLNAFNCNRIWQCSFLMRPRIRRICLVFVCSDVSCFLKTQKLFSQNGHRQQLFENTF